MNNDEINQFFRNPENVYCGHGTGSNNEAVIQSIFKYGLRCSHGNLDYTTMPLGVGEERLFEKIEDMLNNWKHFESKKIIIASLPIDLLLPDGGVLYGKKYSAFYYQISQEEAEIIRETELKDSPDVHLSQGDYLKPEFVRGVYDAKNHTFTPNDRYYENLPEEEQEKLLEEVKIKHKAILKESRNTQLSFSWPGREAKPLPPEKRFNTEALSEQLEDMAESLRESTFNETTKDLKSDLKDKDDTEKNTEEDLLVW